jgi:hypothetical protein
MKAQQSIVLCNSFGNKEDQRWNHTQLHSFNTFKKIDASPSISNLSSNHRKEANEAANKGRTNLIGGEIFTSQ